MVTRSLTLPLLAVVAATLARVGRAGSGDAAGKTVKHPRHRPGKGRIPFGHGMAGTEKSTCNKSKTLRKTSLRGLSSGKS